MTNIYIIVIFQLEKLIYSLIAISTLLKYHFHFLFYPTKNGSCYG